MKVLLIEDNDLVAASLGRALTMRGYDVIHAADCASGIRVATSGIELHAVVSDFMLPDGNGRDVMEKVLASRPELESRYMVMSGGTHDVELDGWMRGLRNFLEKPFSNSDLVRWLQSLP